MTDDVVGLINFASKVFCGCVATEDEEILWARKVVVTAGLCYRSICC
jgi:hypothetical protein